MSEFRVVEQFANYKQPVGSVIQANGKTLLVRDIDHRHIFSKGNYQALFVDKAVIDRLAKENISEAVFNLKGGGAYRIGFDIYRKGKAVKMWGREQVGVRLDNFIYDPTHTPSYRPEPELIIPME